jgi:hypothetical protein
MGLLLPLLSLVAVASCHPHGYQYQLPKEYNSYSHQDGASNSQMEPFRRFLQNYMASSKTQEDHPYRGYMAHPMGNVPVSNYGYESPQAKPYHHKQNSDWTQYMMGEYFFKEHDENHQHFRDDDNEDEEQLPYTVLEKYQVPLQYTRHWLLTRHIVRHMRNGSTPVLSLCATQPMWTLLQTPLPGLRG